MTDDRDARLCYAGQWVELRVWGLICCCPPSLCVQSAMCSHGGLFYVLIVIAHHYRARIGGYADKEGLLLFKPQYFTLT